MLIAICAALSASIAPSPPLAAPPTPAVMTTDEGEESLRKLEEEWDAAMEAYRQRMSEAAPEDRRKVSATRPDPNGFAPRFMEIAKKYPRTPVAELALIWVASNTRGDLARDALVTLVDAHVRSEAIGDLCSGLEDDHLDGPGLLQQIIVGTPHDSVRGMAHLALGNNLKGAAEIAEGIRAGMEEMYTGWYGSELVKKLSDVDPATLSQEAVKNLTTAVEKYGELDSGRGTIADRARGNLFELQNLWFGQIAPEIEAEDLDGVVFKLSDYRGKVVVLDFWGNW